MNYSLRAYVKEGYFESSSMLVLLTDYYQLLWGLVRTKVENIIKYLFLRKGKKHFLLVVKDDGSLFNFDHQKVFVL